MQELSDEVLYQRFRRGNTAAFDMLYQRYRHPLFLFLLRSSPSRADAEDLFQELWGRIIHASGKFHEGSFKAWAFRIARNLQIDLFRRRNLRPLEDPEILDRSPSTSPTPERQAEDADCHRRMLDAIGQLPSEQRETFLLKEETGMRLDEIADLVQVGRETVKSRLRYAMRRLRIALEDCL
jgi:RNA polymerase sigma-70 factor (ECF subfamily)